VHVRGSASDEYTFTVTGAHSARERAQRLGGDALRDP
jgi:hypothetical protein